MLTLHGRAYHRIFDLHEKYSDLNVSNNARFYIFDSKFNARVSSPQLDKHLTSALRTHVHRHVK